MKKYLLDTNILMSTENYEKMFRELFDYYLNALDNNISCDINEIYLNDMDKDYKNSNTNARIVIDYLAGMTDNFFIKRYKENIGIYKIIK